MNNAIKNLIEIFDEIIKKVIAELETNTEWKKRYSNYAEILLGKETAIKNKKAKFNEFSPLYLYINICKF